MRCKSGPTNAGRDQGAIEMTNRERAVDILWHIEDKTHNQIRQEDSTGLDVVRVALNEAERRGIERALSILKEDRSVCDPQSEAWDWINDAAIRIGKAAEDLE